MNGYTKREQELIKLNLCIRCGEEEVFGYRRCRPCRSAIASGKPARMKRKKKHKVMAKPKPKPRPVGRPKKRRGRPKILRGYWPHIHGGLYDD